METMKMLDAPYRASVVLLIGSGGGYVWLAQRSDTCAVMKNQWECPAGKLEPGEDYEAGAVRELKEETGLTVSQERLVPCGITRTRGPGALNCACALFMLQLNVGEHPGNTEPNKRGTWFKFWFPVARIMDCTLGTKMLLDILAEDLSLEKSTLLEKYLAVSMAIKEIEDKVQPEKDCITCESRETVCIACMERARVHGVVTSIRKRVMP